MADVPAVPGAKVVRALERAGFRVVRANGSHHVLRHAFDWARPCASVRRAGVHAPGQGHAQRAEPCTRSAAEPCTRSAADPCANSVAANRRLRTSVLRAEFRVDLAGPIHPREDPGTPVTGPLGSGHERSINALGGCAASSVERRQRSGQRIEG